MVGRWFRGYPQTRLQPAEIAGTGEPAAAYHPPVGLAKSHDREFRIVKGL